MLFATHVRAWRVAHLYSVQGSVRKNISILEIVQSRTRIYIYILLRMTDNVTSQNIDLSFWDTLYNQVDDSIIKYIKNECNDY
jgi:hypothetical protein